MTDHHLLVVANQFDETVGGLETHLQELLPRLAEEGVRVTLYTFDKSFNELEVGEPELDIAGPDRAVQPGESHSRHDGEGRAAVLAEVRVHAGR